jgi:pre-mRNA-splicing factor ISY1
LISPLEANKRRCRYVIYDLIDVSSYYGYRNNEDGILEKFERPTEEEMRGRALRK